VVVVEAGAMRQRRNLFRVGRMDVRDWAQNLDKKGSGREHSA
jgi:hypothetical protein